MNESSDIAILYFSRSERVEASNKYWGSQPGKQQRIQLAKLLSIRTKKVLKSIPLPVFHFDESCQVGDTFGDKLANAYQSLFDQGFEGVIAVGNDCIELHKVDWTTVIEDLHNGRPSIGPDHRNGSYLIGCTKEQFDQKTFAKLSWQTLALIEELKSTFSDASILPAFADFNEQADLDFLLRSNRNNIKFLLLLISIFYNIIFKKSTSSFRILNQKGLPSQHSLRAPPSLDTAS